MVDPGLLFSRYLLKHDRDLLRYIMTFIPRRDDAEEVLQRTVTSLWEKFSEFDAERDFLPWAYRFTYFEILNYRKEFARSRLVFREDVLQMLEATRVEQNPVLVEQFEAMKECLKQLDKSAYELLRRRYCDAESVAALAEETGKTAKALYRKLDRVRELISVCVSRRLAQES